MEQSMVRGLALSEWMASRVKEQRHRCYSVLIENGYHLTVLIARMQVWNVKEFV